MKQICIDNIKFEENAEFKKLELTIENEKLFYKVPSEFSLVESAEPFLAALLIPAMQRGADLVIADQYSISSSLLENLHDIQSILKFWYPGLHQIRVVARSSPVSLNDSRSSTRATFFSGGLDACHTLMKYADSLTHLIYVRGIDMGLEDEELWNECLSVNQELAEHFNKILVPVETNVRFFIRSLTKPAIGWYAAQGAGLASIALALRFPEAIISSSNTYEALQPLGSHPLLDPLWSTEDVKILHKGCELRRHEKLAEAAKDEFVLNRIRVCWQDNGFSCGVCDKCLHFRMALALSGLNSSRFEHLSSFKKLPGAHISSDGEAKEWEDNLLLARKVNNRAAQKAVTRMLNRYKLKKAAKLLDESLLGGAIRRLKSKSG